MKKLAGSVLAGIGLLSILGLAVTPHALTGIPQFLGAYVPGLLFLFVGMALRISAIERPRAADGTDETDADISRMGLARRESEGNAGIVLGFATMLIGSG